MWQWWATSTGEGSLENIKDIDHLVAQNEVTLESCDNVGDNNVGEASSKAKKRKISKNEEMEHCGSNSGCCFNNERRKFST